MTQSNQAKWLAGASILAFAWTANAQTAAVAELEEVVVTGSRVIQNGDDSPTPVTVVTVDQLATMRPATVAEGLNDLPVFAGSAGQLSNPGTGGRNAAANATSGNVVNLRALGLTRTLVLYDGHRVPPTSPEAWVDVDMIPQMLLQRVDVVTGGASAVYGSDAIGGVVNFVTDRRFEGVKFNLQGGVSDQNDDKSADAGIAFGTALFGGRGHLMGSFQSRHSAGIDNRFAREWGRKLWTLQGSGNAAVPYSLVSGAHVTNATFGGRINTGGGALNGQQFTSGGYLIPFAPGSTAGVAPGVAIQLGGDGAWQESTLKASLDMNQLYGRFDFDLTDDLHFYASVSGALNHTLQYTGFVTTQGNTTLSARNAYLLPQYQAQLAANSTFTVGKYFNNATRANSDSYSRHLYVNTGLEGKFGDGYEWDLSLTHGNAKQDNRNNSNLHLGRYSAALDAVINPATNQVVCNVTLTNPGAYPGCVPMNIFGSNSESQAALDYVIGRTSVQPETAMNDVAASVTGAPFSTWAGPVNMALSAEWRRLTYSVKSDTSTTDRISCTGLLYNCNANTTIWSAPVASRSEVSQTVTEGAVEAGVPLLADQAFAKSLDLNVAARYAHYDNSGGATTWKAGLTWDVVDQVTIRASRSRDIRAPNLDELYRVTTVGTNGTNFPDRLTNANYTALGSVVFLENGGNPNLTPEEADTTTYGIVYRPTANLSLALDAYDITIDNTIFFVQGNNPPIQDACYASGGSSPYCLLQQRPLGFTNRTTANVVTRWIQSFLNIAQMKTSGVDFEANWSTSVADRPVTVRALVTHQPHIYYIQPGTTTQDLAGVSFSGGGLPPTANWRATVMTTFKPVDSVTIGLMGRWRSALKHSPDPNNVVASPKVPSAAFVNLNISYKRAVGAGEADFFLNVQNLLNKEPPAAAFFGAAPAPGIFGGYVAGDDPIGRYYTAGVRFRM